MKSGLFLLKLRPQYYVLKPQLYYSNLIIPPKKYLLHLPAPQWPYYLEDKHGGCWADVPPAFKHFLCGCDPPAAAQWFTVWAVWRDSPVANDNKAARQKQHWFTHNSMRPRSEPIYVEVCGRVARSSGDIYTTQTSSHLCPTVSAQLWTRWLTSAIYCFSSWVNSIRKILESGTLCSDLFFTDVWQIKGGEKNHRCVIVRCRATVRLRNSFSVPWHRFTKSLERLIRCSKISHSCSGVFRLWRNTINIISIDFHLLSDLFSPKSNIFP